MAIRAKREGRINVWPNSATALLAGAETPLAKVLHRLTIYDRSSQTIEYQELEDEGGEDPAEYVGPLDIQGGAMVAYSSARALSAANRGSAIYTIREDAGDTTQSFSSDATTGLVSAAAITVFLDSANGFMTLLNDQSGNARGLAQATEVQQPSWVASLVNSVPGIAVVDDGGSDGVRSEVFAFAGGALTIFAVIKIDADTATNGASFFALPGDGTSISGDVALGSFYNAARDIYLNLGLYGGGASWVTAGTMADGSHLIEVVLAADGGVAILLDGVDAGATLEGGVQQPLAAYEFGANASIFSLNILGASGCEAIAWNSAISSGTRLAISQNIAAFYGITLP